MTKDPATNPGADDLPDDATSDTGLPPVRSVRADGDGETLVYAPRPLVAEGDGTFDYAAFDNGLGQADGSQPAPAVERHRDARPWVTSPKRVRAEDATHTTRMVGRFTVVTIQGRINESFDPEGIAAKLKGPVIFDLADVDRVTSFGVRGWLRMLQLGNLQEATFIRCSEHVVNQISMVRNFCGSATIHSLVAPYACAACGAEFGVTLNAIADRELLVGRRAPQVPCPECGKDTRMDEDPFVFFALDEHLLSAPEADLEQAVEHVLGEARNAPVEKVVSGGLSRVRFNGEVGDQTRFQRAFAGLEGDIVVDLTHTTRVSTSGAVRLAENLERLVEDVTSIVVEGAPLELGRMIEDRRLPKVKIRSVRIGARSASGIHRAVLVELERNREAILRNAPVAVDEHWAAGGVTVDDPRALRALLERAAAKAGRTPAPAPQTAGPSGWSATATPGPVQRSTAPPTTQDQYAQNTFPPTMAGWPPQVPYNPNATPAPAAYMQPVVISQPGQVGMVQVLLVGMAMLLLLVSVGIASLAAVVFFRPGVAPPPAPVAAASVMPAQQPVQDSSWSTGGLDAPAWSKEAALENPTHLVLVGLASGSTVSEAEAQARSLAHLHLVQYLRQVVARSPAGAGLASWPPPSSGSAAEGALRAAPVPPPALVLVESAHRQGAQESMAAVRFEISKSELNQWLEPYLAVTDYKGLKLTAAPPWANGVRLLATPTWYEIPIGARLVDVGGLTVSSATEVPEVASRALETLGEGERLQLRFELDGAESFAQIQKKAERKEPSIDNSARPKLWSNPAGTR